MKTAACVSLPSTTDKWGKSDRIFAEEEKKLQPSEKKHTNTHTAGGLVVVYVTIASGDPAKMTLFFARNA